MCIRDRGNSGMAVLLDAGMKTGIHPGKKKVAGERLARLALVDVYKRQPLKHVKVTDCISMVSV